MRLNNKQIIILLIVIVLASLGLRIHQTFFTPEPEIINTLLIKDQLIKIELAGTPAKQILGLSNRANLAQDSGMLFIFNDLVVRNFWMKDMLIPIDIIWINNDKVVGIEKNASIPTATNTPIFRSSEAVNLVLEVNAGYANKHNIKIGDNIYFNVQK